MTDQIIRLTDTTDWQTAFHDPTLGVTAMSGPLPAQPAALEGAYALGQLRRGTLALDGTDRVVQPGEVFLLAPGQVNGWQPSADAAGFVMMRQDAQAAPVAGAPFVLSAADLGEIPPCTPTPAEILVSGDPKQGDVMYVVDARGEWNAGAWETTAYRRITTTFPKHELMYLLDGWLELGEPDGTIHRFEAGDSFLVTKGTVCDWNTGGLRKFYATFTPKG